MRVWVLLYANVTVPGKREEKKKITEEYENNFGQESWRRKPIIAQYSNRVYRSQRKAGKVKLIPSRFLCECTELLHAAVLELS